MSSIVPNGQIRFLTQIPIDANYENSLDFLSEVEQRTYFLSQQPVHTMLGATRIRDGVIAVNSLADNLLSANYMMFQNTNFSNKWFYAFITNIEYVNNNMSHVYYQIDDIQTWLFDVQLAQCFVEREHTATDGMFEHLVDENIGVSEYITNGISGTKEQFNLNRLCVLLFTSSFVVDGEVPDPQIIDSFLTAKLGSVNGLDVYCYPVMDDNLDWDNGYIDSLNTQIRWLTENQKKDGIVGMIMYPYALITNPQTVYPVPSNPKSVQHLDIHNISAGITIDGYTPKNKKLYNSPYCTICVRSSDGQTITLQPEFLASDSEVRIYSNATMTPSADCVVTQYKGLDINYEKHITLDDFPQVSFTTDGYMAWVASGGLEKLNNQTDANILSAISTMALGTLAIGGTVATGGLGAVPILAGGISAAGVGAAVHGGLSLAKTVQNEITTTDYAKNLPQETHGNTKSNFLHIYHELNVFTEQRVIKSDVAKSIDDYFTMFGYKVNKLKQPSRRNRPHYTYLKTKGLHVNGGAPADAIQRIETIYDNGVRFWVNPTEVGNYNVNNAPV